MQHSYRPTARLTQGEGEKNHSDNRESLNLANVCGFLQMTRPSFDVKFAAPHCRASPPETSTPAEWNGQLRLETCASLCVLDVKLKLQRPE